MLSVFLPCSINQQASLASSSFGNPFTNLMWLQSVRVRCPLTVLLTITSSQVGCRSVPRPSFFVRKLYLGHSGIVVEHVGIPQHSRQFGRSFNSSRIKDSEFFLQRVVAAHVQIP